jgi:hypothetical protein
MELNFNWTKVNLSANLASWFHEDERELQLVTAHNTMEYDDIYGKHQLGGTGIVFRHEFAQYARTPSVNPRGLGRWCSWPFSCNPIQVTWIVATYRPCARQVKGSKTVYQQHMHYIQSRGLQTDPASLFDSGLSKQIKEWRGAGESIVLAIDINGHPLHNDLYRQLQERKPEMEELSHKCWGPKAPYMHPAGKSPINRAYKSPEVEIVNLFMLTFAESPGEHRSLCFIISHCSLLGKFQYKVSPPVSWRLVTSQPSLVRTYNEIVREQFEIHCIEEQLDAVDKMMCYCENPLPVWLHAMIIRLYRQMKKSEYMQKKIVGRF